jgi:hypothetical protein
MTNPDLKAYFDEELRKKEQADAENQRQKDEHIATVWESFAARAKQLNDIVKPALLNASQQLAGRVNVDIEEKVSPFGAGSREVPRIAFRLRGSSRRGSPPSRYLFEAAENGDVLVEREGSRSPERTVLRPARPNITTDEVEDILRQAIREYLED